MFNVTSKQDDPWANKGGDDDDDWDTDPDFENTNTIKKGAKEEGIVSAADAQRQLRNQLDDQRATKFGLPKPVVVEQSTFEPPPVRQPPAKTWAFQQELSGSSAVSNARSTFSQPAETQAPPQRSAPPPKSTPAQAPPSAVRSAPAQAPPPAVRSVPPPVAAPPPVSAPPPVQHYEEPSYDQSYDNQGYDQSYDQGGYEEGSYDQSYDNQGYDQSYDQSYDQGGYEEGSYDQGTEEQSNTSLGQCRALYEYTGGGESDLVFGEGAVITILNDSDPSGWWEGELNGQVGYFPSNFVERV